MLITLQELVLDFSDALSRLDATGDRFREFKPGIGPYGEPQLVSLVAKDMNTLPKYQGRVRTKRTPDLLIPGEWAIEIKIVRPYGDNGKEAENWSVNMLHPYAGNVSTLGDCQKLLTYPGHERRAVLVIGYEHVPPRIDLSLLVESFEAIAVRVLRFRLSDRLESRRTGLIHPIHESVRVFAWEVLGREEDA